MTYKKTIKIISLILLIVMILTCPGTKVFASSKIIDSIGSSNTDTSVGEDANQKKNTTYSNAISEDSVQDVEVYGSQSSIFSVLIPKTLILNGSREQENSCTYTVSAKGDIAGDEYIKIAPEEFVQLTQKKKGSIQATIIQDKTLFSYIDGVNLDTPLTQSGKVIAQNMTAGSWKGIFSFNIELINWINTMSDDMFTWTGTEITGLTDTGVRYLEQNNGQLVIPDTATAIYDASGNDTGAFSAKRYPNLIKNVSFAPTITKIGDYAFYANNTTDLSSITGPLILPSNLEYIGLAAFQCCKATGDLIIPDSVTKIKGYAFKSSALNGTLTLSKNLEYIPMNCFAGTHFKGDLIVPEGVKEICAYAFLNDDNGGYGSENSFNGTLTLPDSVKIIGKGAFSGNLALKGELILPKNLEYLGDTVFNHCRKFTNTKIVIPASLKSIGGKPAELCDYSPKNLSIAPYATHVFYDISTTNGVNEFIVEDGNQYFATHEGVLYSKDFTRLVSFPDHKLCKTYTMPEGVITMDGLCFGIVPNEYTEDSKYLSTTSKYLKTLILPDSFVINMVPDKSYTNLDDGVYFSMNWAPQNYDSAQYTMSRIYKIQVKDTNSNYYSSSDGSTIYNKSDNSIIAQRMPMQVN